jgi:molybdopterin-guanine dinucleotide biosynthesis protein A
MGKDKALVAFHGQALIVHATTLLREAGLRAAIAGARSDLSAFGRVVEDGGLGPLGGICAALGADQREYAVFVSVDTPLLPAGLLAAQLESAQRTGMGITLASVSGFPQTFPAVVHRSLLPALESELRAGNGGCFAAFRSAAERTKCPLRILAVEELVQAGRVEHPQALPAAYWFLNLNSPVDLAHAESLWPVGHRVI